MAGPNESNKKGMNQFADDIDRSSTLSELERIGSRASRKGIQRTELEDRIRGEGKLLNSLLEQGRTTPEFRDSPFYQQQTSGLRESIKGVRARMNSLDTTARTRAESEASSYIARQFAPTAINAQASTMQREAATQNRAFSMSGMSHDELAARREDVLADIRVRERNAQNEVKGMFTGRGEVNPERSAALGVMMGGTRDNIRQLATLNAAQALQKAAGNDPNSKIRNLAEMGQVATGLLNADAVAKEVNSGSVSISSGGAMQQVANSDVNKEVMNQARALANALKELADGAGKTDEELSKLRNSADESAANLEKLQDAQRAGAGGGGNNNANIAMGLAGGFNALGGAAQQIMVNQRMTQVANVGGFAGLANQQYDMYTKARGGDVASQLALSQFGEADQFGMEMKRATNVVQGLGVAAGVAQGAAGGIQMAEGGAQKFNPLAYAAGASSNNTQAVITGAQNLTAGAATAAIHGTDMARGASAQAARLAGIQSQMQARMAVNAVGAQQAQGLRNFMTDLDVVGQNMGGRASSFIQNSTSTENLGRMAESRLSPEQFAKLSGQGASDMGSLFSADQVFASRNLERAGFGSAQVNMQRMGQLAGAGANNPAAGMESVLAAAMTKGLDSSKAINDMVSNTAAMVSTSVGAQTGIDTTAAAAGLLGAQIDPNMANKEFAANRAATAQQIAQGLTTNDSVSFSGMVNTARISQSTGLGGTQAIMAQKLDTATLKSMLGMSEEDRDKALLNRGIDTQNSKMGNSKDLVQKLLDADQREILEAGGSAFGVGMDVNKVQDKLKRGEKLTRAEQAQVGQAAVGAGFSGADELLGARGAVAAPNAAPGAAKAAGDAMAGTGADDLKKQMDTLRTSGFKQLSEAAGSAATKLNDFGGALKVFTDLTAKFEKGGMENESTFSESASKFAQDFSASTGRFDDSVTKFEDAVKMLSDKAGLKSNANPVLPNELDSKRGASNK